VNTRSIISKILIVTAWMAVASGLTTLLIAANRKEQNHLCKDVRITIKGVGENFYIDKGDIITILKNGSDKKLIGQPLNKMNLARMEKLLEKSSWVADAEMYFDSRDVLHITAIEREPIARIFTTAGTSFYIDSTAKRMPLLQKMSVRVPVVTNFPWSKKMNSRDRALIKEVRELSMFVNNDPFWNAQVAQIDIVNGKTFEIIPTIGNHVIRIGNTENLNEKFNRLYLFYKKVLSKTGFDHYSMVDVQFADQVVAAQRGTTSKVDSIQLQKNIKELMLQAQKAQEAQMPMNIDSTSQPKVATQYNINTDGSKIIEKPMPLKPSNTTKTTNTKPGPTLEKTTVKPKTVVKKKEVKKSSGIKPKAVMKRVN
jgi:cell division protein FtsQ